LQKPETDASTFCGGFLRPQFGGFSHNKRRKPCIAARHHRQAKNSPPTSPGDRITPAFHSAYTVPADRLSAALCTLTPTRHDAAHRQNHRRAPGTFVPNPSRPKEEPKEYAPPRDSGAYVPQLAARLDEDRNPSDGARRCARKVA
jgi:hypothetical protein